jgi:transposase
LDTPPSITLPGYANTIREELRDAAVLGAFHVVKLAGQALDEVQRRVQEATLGRRGHKDDPLCKVRGTLLGVKHLNNRQHQRLERYLPIGVPDGEVELTWRAYQQVRSIYHAQSPAGRRPQPRRFSTHCTPARSPRSSVSAQTLRYWPPRS